jgi:hypothetical protein
MRRTTQSDHTSSRLAQELNLLNPGFVVNLELHTGTHLSVRVCGEINSPHSKEPNSLKHDKGTSKGCSVYSERALRLPFLTSAGG